MGLLDKLKKAAKKVVKKVVKSPVLGGVVGTVLPPLAPVIKAANVVSSVKTAAKAAVKAQAPPVANLSAVFPAVPAQAFGSFSNPLAFPVNASVPNFPAMNIVKSAAPAAQAGVGGPMAAAPLVTSMMAGAGRVLSAAGRFIGIRTAAGKLIRRKQIVSAAKKFGLEATAAAVGLSVVEIAQLVVEETGKPRRARGITGAQLRNASATIRRMKRFNQLVGLSCRSSRSPRRT